VSVVLPPSSCAGRGIQIVSDGFLSPKVLHDPTTLDRLRRLHAKWDAFARDLGLNPAKRTEVFDPPSSTPGTESPKTD
jgi:hypothetical protein